MATTASYEVYAVRGVEAIGIDPLDVETVLNSHMHYDHAGNHDLFPNATYHIQDKEMAYCTGRCMCHRVLRSSFEPDAIHLYANIEQERPYPVIYNLADMLEGYATLRRLASSSAHIVPGHDPLVLTRYPSARPGLKGIAVRLDADPRG
jgi:glyoxylase-like metal-dependent hydrolase (beta-lactamase superfamily II)